MDTHDVPSGLEAEVLLVIDELHEKDTPVTFESVAAAFSPVTPADVRVAVERLREHGYVTELTPPGLEPVPGKGTEAIRRLREAS